MSEQGYYRVIDANLNRLREGIRVAEEVFRFILIEESTAVQLKELRHKVRAIEEMIPAEVLLGARNSSEDMFNEGSVAKELSRDSVDTLVRANLRRAQEAARVLEEFLKLSMAPESSEVAKEIRFQLYTIEKEWGSGEK